MGKGNDGVYIGYWVVDDDIKVYSVVTIVDECLKSFQPNSPEYDGYVNENWGNSETTVLSLSEGIAQSDAYSMQCKKRTSLGYDSVPIELLSPAPKHVVSFARKYNGNNMPKNPNAKFWVIMRRPKKEDEFVFYNEEAARFKAQQLAKDDPNVNYVVLESTSETTGSVIVTSNSLK